MKKLPTSFVSILVRLKVWRLESEYPTTIPMIASNKTRLEMSGALESASEREASIPAGQP